MANSHNYLPRTLLYAHSLEGAGGPSGRLPS